MVKLQRVGSSPSKSYLTDGRSAWKASADGVSLWNDPDIDWASLPRFWPDVVTETGRGEAREARVIALALGRDDYPLVWGDLVVFGPNGGSNALFSSDGGSTFVEFDWSAHLEPYFESFWWSNGPESQVFRGPSTLRFVFSDQEQRTQLLVVSVGFDARTMTVDAHPSVARMIHLGGATAATLRQGLARGVVRSDSLLTVDVLWPSDVFEYQPVIIDSSANTQISVELLLSSELEPSWALLDDGNLVLASGDGRLHIVETHSGRTTTLDGQTFYGDFVIAGSSLAWLNAQDMMLVRPWEL